ncbi:hypothetical protein ANO11243_059300 [Dothideomycetidae sp. 11243]|nr:hypothetical protein ANO11243_059300 [fungal sp. No.11243]
MARVLSSEEHVGIGHAPLGKPQSKLNACHAPPTCGGIRAELTRSQLGFASLSGRIDEMEGAGVGRARRVWPCGMSLWPTSCPPEVRMWPPLSPETNASFSLRPPIECSPAAGAAAAAASSCSGYIDRDNRCREFLLGTAYGMRQLVVVLVGKGNGHAALVSYAKPIPPEQE